jgi:cysteinyl-tRNA synthetase
MRKFSLKLYNTETRQKEEIVPADGRVIRMYTCGPTVYNFAHIGNFRTYVFEDLLRRCFKFFDFQISQAMNITDIDDKTIKGAIERKVSLDAFTKPYKEAFFEDLKTLSIEQVEYYPQATDYIPEMITIIQDLIEKGFAYRGHDGSIYFAIAKFPSYGRLSHLHLHELQAGASKRVATDEYDKENASDFVLWKSYEPERDGQIFWESPFGKGRPGWHIECSAMAMKLLGQTIDVHVGAVDNIFPHHENEIAQSEAYSSCLFVKHWLHAEHLLVDHKKMSKSLGNFYTLRDLLKKGYRGRAVRYMLLQTHYRTQLNFTVAGLDGAVSALERFSDFIQRLQGIRREKMHKAFDLILEKALPETSQKKQICARILYDVQADKERDILDPDQLKPLLERSLVQIPEKGQLLDRILTDVKSEKERTVLTLILEKTLQGHPDTQAILTKIIHDVRDEKESNILNPVFMKPILQKALREIPAQKSLVETILYDLKVKKDHGFILPILEKTMLRFSEHLADDLNISPALAALFDMIREVNSLCDRGKIGISEAEDVLDFLHKVDQVLGVLPFDLEEEPILPELEEALKKREIARTEKNWQLADQCRDLIQSRGYCIEDTPYGARLKKKGSS